MINIHDLPQEGELVEMSNVEAAQIIGGADNWLVNVAAQLGQVSGKRLQNMTNLGAQLGSVDAQDNPEAFAQMNAEFQAESQIFKLQQESIAAVIKSIGEQASSSARRS